MEKKILFNEKEIVYIQGLLAYKLFSLEFWGKKNSQEYKFIERIMGKFTDDEDEVVCKICKEVWYFEPDDYPDRKHPTERCPFCSMPFTQMISESYKFGGIKEVVKRIFIRIINL
jgi:hypothetical protein